MLGQLVVPAVADLFELVFQVCSSGELTVARHDILAPGSLPDNALGPFVVDHADYFSEPPKLFKVVY